MKKALVSLLVLACWTGFCADRALAGGGALTINFDKGLSGQTENGNFKFKFGGRVMVDYADYNADGALEGFLGEMFEDDSEFRRNRLYVSGSVYENIIFKAQYDFAGDNEVDFFQTRAQIDF